MCIHASRGQNYQIHWSRVAGCPVWVTEPELWSSKDWHKPSQSLSHHLGLHKGKATHCLLPGCLYLPPSRCNMHIFSLHFIFLNKLGTFLEHSTYRWALPFACLQLGRNRQLQSPQKGGGWGGDGRSFLPATLSFSRLTDPRPAWLVGSTDCVWIRLKRNKQEQKV